MLNLFRSIFDLCKRVYFLFFYPDKLKKLACEKTPKANPNQIEQGIRLVREHVFRAFKIAFGTALFSVFVYGILNLFHVHVPHKFLIMSRFAGYVLILWGIMSPVGWKISTASGETLPEIIDEQWHRLIYVIGLIVLLLSYLLEI